MQPKLFSAGVVLMVVVCRGCVCARVCVHRLISTSEWVHTQSCFCFWGLLSRGRTIPPVSTPPILFSFSFSPCRILSFHCLAHTPSPETPRACNLIYRSFCLDRTVGPWRQSLWICLSEGAGAHISVWETLTVIHFARKGKKKKEGGHKLKQP